MTDKAYRDKLKFLQEICDGDIALHSMELAIAQVCCDLTYQSRAQVLRLSCEIIVNESQRQNLLPQELASELGRRGTALLKRFENMGHITDFDEAIAIQRKLNTFTLVNSADRPLMLTTLGSLYRDRYERFGDVKDIDSAIRQLAKALASIPPDSAHRPAILINFGAAYLLRSGQFAERKDFDSAIDQMLEAVSRTTSPLKSADRADLLSIIGSLYRTRFEQFEDIKDLDTSIEQLLEAVSIPLNRPNPVIHGSLGSSYLCRFKRFGAIKDISSAIEQHLKASASIPPNSVLYPVAMANLGKSYRSRFDCFGNIQDLESAIKHQLEAVASIPFDNPNRPRILNDLANSYTSRFDRFGKKQDIDFAIKQNLEALASVPLDSPERAKYFGSLGNSYSKRFRHFEEINDLDCTIKYFEAFKLSSTLPDSLQDHFFEKLRSSYSTRFTLFGYVKDIDSTIELLLEAVASNPLQSPSSLDDLGRSYQTRFIRFGEVKDIDLAIKQHLQALEALTSTPLESAERPRILNNLGRSHLMRFYRFGEMKDINLSIKLLLEALSSTPLDTPPIPDFVADLGNAYAHRFIKHSRDVKDIDLAIKKMLEAVASDRQIQFINNLGTFHLYRYQFFWEAKDIEAAIENFTEVVAITPLNSPDRALYLSNLGDSYLLRFRSNQEPDDLEKSIINFRLSSLSLNGLPSTRIKGSLEWARLAHKLNNNLGTASEAYDQAVRLLPQVAWIGLNATAQLKELNSGIQRLGCNAAACMIALAEAASEHHDRQHHLGRAIEFLEQGRSILWSQTSNFKRDLEDLKEVDSDLADDLDNVGKFLAQGCFRDPNGSDLSEIDAQSYRRHAEKWEELVHRIRGFPGFHHFMLPSPISTLRTAAAEGPVVIINSSEYRCDAVIVRSQGDLVLVPLPNITGEEIKSLADQQEEFASRKSKSVWIPSKDYIMQSETLEQLLNRTWLLVGEPIVQKFKELGLVRGSEGSSKTRVWWCLTGSLSFLPIHASFPPTKPGIGMMDIVVSSYTPTISTLLRAQQRNKLKRPTFRMLAVGQSSIAGMTPLPGVTEEIAFIQKILGVEALTLDEHKATVDRVASSLPTCSWAHFACHGVQDPVNPMDSGLMMWDRHRLTLSRLARSSLGSAEFAFLSCCESAKGSKQFPNEAMHLAAGLQFIGYRGVIGTMWSVGDRDALNVAMQIYGELFKDGTGRASASKAALALHQAVLHLRANNVPLARWVPFVHFGL